MKTAELGLAKVAQRHATLHAFSVDVEDWFHILDCEGAPDSSAWDSLPARVEHGTLAVLDALDSYGHRATFYVLGWIADRHPALVREIAARGHELGSHSYGHAMVSSLSPTEFARDLEQSMEAISRAAGVEVKTYRAPGFSIGPKEVWALELLADAGITVDSSLFLAARAHGGWPLDRRRPFELWLPSGRRIHEVPVIPLRVGSVSLPYSGGGYLRLLPMEVLKRLFDAADYASEPAVAYLHPRELDPKQPRMALPPWRRFKYYVGLDGVDSKLRALLARYRFETISTVAARSTRDPPVVLFATQNSGPSAAQ
jgi:peptidoglycan-N-acetylglucosamine deacetylase